MGGHSAAAILTFETVGVAVLGKGDSSDDRLWTCEWMTVGDEGGSGPVFSKSEWEALGVTVRDVGLDVASFACDGAGDDLADGAAEGTGATCVT